MSPNPLDEGLVADAGLRGFSDQIALGADPVGNGITGEAAPFEVDVVGAQADLFLSWHFYGRHWRRRPFRA